MNRNENNIIVVKFIYNFNKVYKSPTYYIDTIPECIKIWDSIAYKMRQDKHHDMLLISQRARFSFWLKSSKLFWLVYRAICDLLWELPSINSSAK